ncbi:MAG: hypothetical protein EPO02_05000 [Nitrospirae bacterium]|nr:MAG: hypothetical protein EPO02_05000 [Nitrospirota bacterium]
MPRKKTAPAPIQGDHPVRAKIDFRLLAGGTAVLALLIFAVDLLTPLGVAVGVLYTTLVVLAMWSPHRRFIFFVAAGVSILTLFDVFLSHDDANWMVMSNRLLSLFTIWIAAVLSFLLKRDQQERERLILDLQDSLDHIKTLRGLLPVCVSCKKVRNGQGYWKSIDTYVSERAETQITHGICPDCFTHYYPTTVEPNVAAK